MEFSTAQVEKIQALIRQGENSAVEFKSYRVLAESVAREMTAFANSLGGVILLGIADDGDIEGLDDSRNWEEWVANIARQNVIPPLLTQFKKVEIEEKSLGCIEIPKGPDRPYQSSRYQFVIRVGSTNRMELKVN